MIHYDSPFWNWETGVCSKHLLPSVPCPKCIHTNDEDMTSNLNHTEDSLMEELRQQDIEDGYLNLLSQEK